MTTQIDQEILDMARNNASDEHHRIKSVFDGVYAGGDFTMTDAWRYANDREWHSDFETYFERHRDSFIQEALEEHREWLASADQGLAA